jgi:hypothetical protein
VCTLCLIANWLHCEALLTEQNKLPIQMHVRVEYKNLHTNICIYIYILYVIHIEVECICTLTTPNSWLSVKYCGKRNVWKYRHVKIQCSRRSLELKNLANIIS